MFVNHHHVAYNCVTGEVLTCSTANQLKRWVARHTKNDNEWAKANGCKIGHKWVFAHGADWQVNLAIKLRAMGEWA